MSFLLHHLGDVAVVDVDLGQRAAVTVGFVMPAWLLFAEGLEDKKKVSVSGRLPPLSYFALAGSGDGQAKAQRMEERVEASQFGVPALRQHFVEAFAIELGFLRELRHPALRLRHVSQREEK